MLGGASSYVLFLFEETVFWSIHLLKIMIGTISSGISYQFRFTIHFACHWILLFILQATVFCYLFFRPLNFTISPEEYEDQIMKKTKVPKVRYIIFIGPNQSIWIQLNFQRKGYGYVKQANYIHTNFANSPPSLSKELNFIISELFSIFDTAANVSFVWFFKNKLFICL